MKKLLLSLIIATLLCLSCKTEKKETRSQPEEPMNILEQIAEANGYEHWQDIKELQFTLNADRDSSHFERKWIWHPKTNEVWGISQGDSAQYNRSQVDSTTTRIDAAFVNDKYWLLAPFQLIWDQESFTFEHQENVASPIANVPMHKLTIVYDSEGGYTPGDAYDFYFEDDLLFKEWVFRKANQEEPSMITSWEGYQDYQGVKLALMHKKADESFSLYFSEVSAKK